MQCGTESVTRDSIYKLFAGRLCSQGGGQAVVAVAAVAGGVAVISDDFHTAVRKYLR